MDFVTTNLLIRESIFEDVDSFYVWERMSEVTEFFSIPYDQTREQVTTKYIEDKAKEDFRQFTICLKDGTPIGRIVIGDIIAGWKAEVWRIYIADTKLRNCGYGREAMLAMMKYCFDDLQLQRLYLDHYTGNPAAYLYKSLGFKYEGILRDNCRKNGILYDVHLMSMLKKEYEEMYK